MATPAPALKACAVEVNLFSGARTPLPAGTQVLLTIRNGNQETVPLSNNGFFTAAHVEIPGLPFHDNFGDNYAVVASADGYDQAGFFPVRLTPSNPAVADLMLLKKDATFNFRNASWAALAQSHPEYASLLRAGAADDVAAADRYGQLLENRGPVLACFLNLVTAMGQIQLPDKTPLFYIRELLWDRMQQDRFFAWADPALIDQIVRAA